MKKRSIFIIQHAEDEGPGALSQILKNASAEPKLYKTYEETDLDYLNNNYTKITSTHCGVISLGGFMNSNDEETYPWIKSEISFIKKLTDQNFPFLGICLGAQLLARSLGGKIEKNPEPEVGWQLLKWNKNAEKCPILNGIFIKYQNTHFFQWHLDTFFQPRFFLNLGSTTTCERQAFSVTQNIMGVQFHPEVTRELLQKWLEIGGKEEVENLSSSPSVQSPEMFFNDEYFEQSRKFLNDLVFKLFF